MARMDDVGFWDSYHAQFTERAQEWYLELSHAQDLMLACLKPSFKAASCLHIGCGSSDLQWKLREMGFMQIINIDYSVVIIDIMRKRSFERGIPNSEMSFEATDVRDMKCFDSQSFDVLVDKGTFDSTTSRGDATAKSVNATAMLRECYRVMKPCSEFLLCSLFEPSERLCYLEGHADYPWTVQYVPLDVRPLELPDQAITHLYILRKNAARPGDSKEEE